jgi:hypothetical protein
MEKHLLCQAVIESFEATLSLGPIQTVLIPGTNWHVARLARV